MMTPSVFFYIISVNYLIYKFKAEICLSLEFIYYYW